MKFSVFYRLSMRDIFFEKFWEKESSKFSKENVQLVEGNMRETMEIIAYHIIRKDIEQLKILLARANAKYARVFYDYMMKSNTKSKSIAETVKTIEQDFNNRDEV